jgi:hypothetical protein
MKKRFLCLCLTAAALLMVACSPDERELLRHPYRVQGELNPTYRLPVVSSGQLNLRDLLMSFDGTMSGNLELNDTTIVFLYSDSFNDSIVPQGGNSKRGQARVKHNGAKSATGIILMQVDTTISYSIPIDLFDKADLQNLVEADISIERLLLDLTAHISGYSNSPTVNETLREYVTAIIDSLEIIYEGHNGAMYNYLGLPDGLSVQIDDIVEGGSLDLSGDNQINLASIINRLPRNITFSFKLHLLVDNGILVDNMSDFASIQNNEFSKLLDSLQMTKFYYNADLAVRVPFEVGIGGLTFSYPLELNQNASEQNESIFDILDSTLTKLFGEGAVSMDSSNVVAFLVLENAMPLEFGLDATFLDANDNEIDTMFTGRVIPAADTMATGLPGVYQSNPARPGIANIPVALTVGSLQNFLNAAKLRLDLSLRTNYNNENKRMRVRPDDYLNVRLHIQLNPNIVIDMPLFDGFGSIPGLSNIPVIGDIIGGNGNGNN